MKWLNFLHFYQPVNADAYHIQEAAEHSYARILRALEENPDWRLTANFSGCLLSRLQELGYGWMLQRFSALVKSGRLEIVGSAAYHGFLPLLPIAEAQRQILENEDLLQQYFGVPRPAGFFLPEMAYSPAVARLLKRLGYKWIILDEIAYDGTLRLSEKFLQSSYRDRNSGLDVILRSRHFSNCYAPEKLAETLDKKLALPDVVISATDAELYGLRHKDQSANLERFLRRDGWQAITASEFLTRAPQGGSRRFQACSWESTPTELRAGKPYMLWQDPKNMIHKQLWELADYAYKITNTNANDPNYHWARWHLVRGLASCTFWWASGRDLSHNFGPRAWSPDEIERGVNELIRSIRSLENPKTRSAKMAAEKLYLKIKRLIWRKHWRYHWQPSL
jgi:predicted glycosyl hydrolase (DUF1957 family)